MVFCYWYHAGIKQISNIFDSRGAIFSCSIKYSFLSNFNIKRVFLILALFVLIPPNQKKLFKEDSFDPVSIPISIHSLTCRIIYSLLLNHEDQPPPTSEKKRRASGVAKKALAKIQLSSFKATRELKLAMFQYNIIHRILPMNSSLLK